MTNATTIEREVDEKILSYLASSTGAIPKSWLVQQVLQALRKAHPDVRGADLEFVECCLQELVVSRVERVFRWIEQNENPEALLDEMRRRGLEAAAFRDVRGSAP